MPYSSSSAIQVSLLDATPEISRDAEYRRTGYKKGLLRWDLDIPAQAVNNDAVTVSYKLRMAHEKGKALQETDKSPE